MEDNSFNINSNNASVAALEVLVQVYARQEALIHLVMDKLIERGENETELVKDFDADYLFAKKTLMRLLYEDYGDIDLKGLFDENA
jgi:hypothetical protein